MIKPTIVTSQSELNAAVAASAPRIIIDSPNDVLLAVPAGDIEEIRGSSQIVYVSGSAYVAEVSDSAQITFVRGSARIASVRGAARITQVRDSARITQVCDSARITQVRDSARITYVRDSAHISDVSESVQITDVGDSAQVTRVRGSARITYVSDSAWIADVSGSARITEVYDSAHISSVRDSAQIAVVRGSAQVSDVIGSAQITDVSGSARIAYVRDSAQIARVRDSAQIADVSGSAQIVHAAGTSIVHLYGGTLGKAGPQVAVFVHTSESTWLGGTLVDLRGMDEEDTDTWVAFHSVESDGDDLIVYKAVNDDLRSSMGFKYPIGDTVTDPKWTDNHECGGGLHLSPSPAMASDYFGEATRFLECRVARSEVRTVPGGGAAKLKAPRVRVIREVGIDGHPIGGAE